MHPRLTVDTCMMRDRGAITNFDLAPHGLKIDYTFKHYEKQQVRVSDHETESSKDPQCWESEEHLGLHDDWGCCDAWYFCSSTVNHNRPRECGIELHAGHIYP